MRLIDADALMFRLEKRNNIATDLAFAEGLSAAMVEVEDSPTISPDEVRGVGEWIWHDNYGWDDSIECSCCAEEFVVYDGEFPGIDSFKFCPRCGARMKGASEDA